MRCTQLMGFGKHNPLQFPEERCSHCGQDIPLEMKVYAYDGMFDEFPLHHFKIGDDEFVEVVQHSIWSSGPMLYMAYNRLRDNTLFNYWEESELEQ